MQRSFLCFCFLFFYYFYSTEQRLQLLGTITPSTDTMNAQGKKHNIVFIYFIFIFIFINFYSTVQQPPRMLQQLGAITTPIDRTSAGEIKYSVSTAPYFFFFEFFFFFGGWLLFLFLKNILSTSIYLMTASQPPGPIS